MILNAKGVDRIIFCIVIAFQSVLYLNFYRREIAWYPPRYFDQAVYLLEAYRLQEDVLAHGLGKLWEAIRSGGHFSGLALPIEGALMGIFLGGSRLPQLCVNFSAFVALQAVAFTTARAIWGSRAFGYMALGLILCQGTAWQPIGGLFDFRIDFLAYCLYGIWVCVVMRSCLFLDRRWSIACGLIAAFLVLNRFVTSVYVLGVCSGFAAVCLAAIVLSRANLDFVRRIRFRLYNLGLSLGILVIIVAPILLRNHKAIYDYYAVGHALGNEKFLRAKELGVIGLRDHLLYYPRSVFFDHLGPTFLWAAAISLASAFIFQLLSRTSSSPRKMMSCRDETLPLQLIFLVGAVLCPMIVLTVDIAKSPVVGGIVGVPVALLLVAVTQGVIPNPSERESSTVGKMVQVYAWVIFALGLFQQFSHASTHLPEYVQRRDLERLIQLNKWFVEYSAQQGWQKPRISCDVILEWFNFHTIAASGFEESHQLIEFQPLFGNSLMGVDRSAALSMLAASDFVILTTLPKTGVYPFYELVSQYWGDLKAWADENMLVARTVQFGNFIALVYVRPTATVSDLSGGWITSYGFSVEAQRAALRRFPIIRLSGPCDYSRLPKTPVVAATIETEEDHLAVPASWRRINDSYEIMIDTSSIALPWSDRIRTHISFNSFFVPKNLGINDDTRELVAPAPKIVELIRAIP
jgi:hypothetical protein